MKAEQSLAPGSGAGGADRFRRKACAGEEGGLGGAGQSDSCLTAGRSNDDNQMMDVASDQEPAPLSKPVHAVFTIEQVWPHFDALMAEELPDRKSTRLNSSHKTESRMPSSA